jgi:hypothetical protein
MAVAKQVVRRQQPGNVATMLRILNVPRAFRPAAPFPYPGHQAGPLVEEFVENYLRRHAGEIDLDGDWTYVPIHWTNHACQLGELRRWRLKWRLARIQRWLDKTLRPDVNYFTVSQHADGLAQANRLTLPQPILQFNCGGTGDVPLPLLCDPHPTVERPRDIWASFVGALGNTVANYPCRQAMVDALASRPEYKIVDVRSKWGENDKTSLAKKTDYFVNTMCRSTFTLCPRGYGRTSFRLYEAMQLGSVPVYIYDDPWLPFADELDWNRLAVLVPVSEIDGLDERLSAIKPAEIERMRQYARDHWEAYFTLSGVANQVVRQLSRAQAIAA